MQGSRSNAKLLILPVATDLVCTQFHLFMNTIITAGRPELSCCFSQSHSLIEFIAPVAKLDLTSDLSVADKHQACAVLKGVTASMQHSSWSRNYKFIGNVISCPQ